MSVVGAKFSIRQDSIEWQARTKLAELANKIAASRALNKANPYVLQATKIRLWLKALDSKDFLTRTQREQLWYAIIKFSGIYDFPTAPVLGERSRPSVLLVS